ncbi:MAG: hypothetical protein SWX82_30890 [Cyanobacteriota bacterium]|nr:hypothetical protein [Cyanobacteriota bacterium]
MNKAKNLSLLGNSSERQQLRQGIYRKKVFLQRDTPKIIDDLYAIINFIFDYWRCLIPFIKNFSTLS